MSHEATTWVFAQDIKPAAAKLCLLALANYADTDGVCFPSYKTLSKKTGISQRSIIKYFSEMSDDGFLIKHKRMRDDGSQTSNIYQIPINIVCHPPVNPSSPPSDTGLTPPSELHYTPPVNSSSPHESSSEFPISKSPVKPLPLSAEFESFWKAYPKKKEKAAARMAWDKIKPDSELVSTIMQAVEAQSKSHDWKKEDGQYVPYAARWLVKGRWTDEVVETSVERDNRLAGITDKWVDKPAPWEVESHDPV